MVGSAYGAHGFRLFMIDLKAIARSLRASEESLRRPLELLRQGYSPAFLATYRSDEIGQLDYQTLRRLRSALRYQERLESHRAMVEEQLQRDQLWNEAFGPLLTQARSVAEIDLLTRGIRSRKGARALAEKQPEVPKMGQALLALQGSGPLDVEQWVGQQAGVGQEEAKALTAQVRRWIQLLLHEDPVLMDRIASALRRRSQVAVEILPDNHEQAAEGSSEEMPGESPEASANNQSLPEVTGCGFGRLIQDQPGPQDAENLPGYDGSAPALQTKLVASVDSSIPTEPSAEPNNSDAGLPEAPEATANVESSGSIESVGASNPTTEGTETIDENVRFGAAKSGPLRGGKKSPAKGKTAPPRSAAKLSPRQKRRRWLRGILDSYSKLRSPLDRLTPYQVVMLGRGTRSQLTRLVWQYDNPPLIQAARELLAPAKHPAGPWLDDLVLEAMNKQILPKLEQDLFAEFEEKAQHALVERAVESLQSSLQQRPLTGRTILAIDSVGPKSAPIAVVDPQGNVLHTDELPASSSRKDLVATNVVLLGEIIHRYKVSLVALSNGPARRFLIHTIKQLLEQSDGNVTWTMVDRAGADAYCATRECLAELPTHSRRHRAAVWLARKLQDPLAQLLKVDAARLRLGSFQREVPDTLLEQELEESVRDTIAKRGVDYWSASKELLQTLPGITPEIAEALVAFRQEQPEATRQQVADRMREQFGDTTFRQSLGFLRVFGSSEPLDGTSVHPEDYRLAQRLIAQNLFPAPSPNPEGWIKPSPAAAPVAAGDASSVALESDTTTESLDPSESFGEISSEESADLPSDATFAEPLPDSSTELPGETESEEPVVTAEEMAAAAAALAESESSEEPGTGEAASVASEPVTDATSPVSQEPSSTPNPQVRMIRCHVDPPIADSALAIDVEKLARSWQVGRGRLRYVARALQQPHRDLRDNQPGTPLLDGVPTLENLQPGMSAWAVVIGVADFGAFVDLGPDCSGLIHISRLSSDFIKDPNQVVQVGDLIQVWVLNVDSKRRRVVLSAISPQSLEAKEKQAAAMAAERMQPRRDGRDNRDGRDRNAKPGAPRSQGNAAPRGRSDRGGPGARSSSGPDRAGSGGGGGRGGNGRFQQGRKPQRAENNESANSAPATKPSPKVERPKPSAPISDAMQKGKEPLRSFSDLMQFYQGKREEPPAAEPPPNQESSPSVPPNQAESAEGSDV
jgi:uncharacterized protein